MNDEYWKTHRQAELELLQRNLKAHRSRLKGTMDVIDVIERQIRGIVVERVLQREIEHDELQQEKLI